jgi:GTPase
MDNPTLKADDPFIQVDPSFKEYCKIAVVGNVDSGKSTLVGVLTKGDMDDGRGSARMKVFNFDHEKKNGRTSSIA